LRRDGIDRALALKSTRSLNDITNNNMTRKATTSKLKVGEWVLVYFPQDDVGKMRKLTQPWHGPYRMISLM